MLEYLKKKHIFPYKILYIANDINSGGAENILFNILKNQNKNEVFLISLTKIGFYGKQLQENGYKVYSMGIKKDIFSLFKFVKLFFLIKKLKPNLVHTWLYHSNLIGGLLAKLLGVKRIYWSIHHDFEYSSIFSMIEMKILIIFSYFIPDKIVFCSAASYKNHITKGYKENCSKIITNGVSTSRFKPNINFKNQIRSRLNISEECLLLGNISRYHPLKDHELLLKSLSILNNYKINFKCILVGKGLDQNNLDLQYKLRNYDLLDKVILYGKSFEVEKLINAFDINILSSKKESFPMVLLESMSSGIPCISTNVGDAKQIIGNTGWVIEVSDHNALASCIFKIARNKDIIKLNSNIARKRVIDNFSLEKMISNYSNLYNY